MCAMGATTEPLDEIEAAHGADGLLLKELDESDARQRSVRWSSSPIPLRERAAGFGEHCPDNLVQRLPVIGSDEAAECGDEIVGQREICGSEAPDEPLAVTEPASSFEQGQLRCRG